MEFKFKIGDLVRWGNPLLQYKMSAGEVLGIDRTFAQPAYRIKITAGTDAGTIVTPNAFWADAGGLHLAEPLLYKLYWSDANGCNDVLLGAYATEQAAQDDAMRVFQQCAELDTVEGLYNGQISCEYAGYKIVFVIIDLIPF